MYFLALATDYDGTIAAEGVVDSATLSALAAFKKTGRRLVLVTGRELDDLKRVFSELHLFEGWSRRTARCSTIGERGGASHRARTAGEIHRPARGKQCLAFVHRRSIVATWEPHEKTVLEASTSLASNCRSSSTRER